MPSMLSLNKVYLDAKHPTIRANGYFTLIAVVRHLNFVFWTFRFYILLFINLLNQMFNIANKSFTLCEVAQVRWLSTMWTLCSFFFNPSPQTFLAGNLTAGRTHFWFLQSIKADIAIKERKLRTLIHSLKHNFNIIEI